MERSSAGIDRGIEHAIAVLREALHEYLRANCRRIVSMARLAGQRRVRIELYGPFRYFSPTDDFPRFTDALSAVIDAIGENGLCSALGCSAVSRSGEDDRLWYLVFDVEQLEKLCRDIGAL